MDSSNLERLDDLFASTDTTQWYQAAELLKPLTDPMAYDHILAGARLSISRASRAGHVDTIRHERYPSWASSTHGLLVLLRLLADAPEGLPAVDRLQKAAAQIAVSIGGATAGQIDFSGLRETESLHILGHERSALLPEHLHSIGRLPRLRFLRFRSLTLPSLTALQPATLQTVRLSYCTLADLALPDSPHMAEVEVESCDDPETLALQLGGARHASLELNKARAFSLVSGLERLEELELSAWTMSDATPLMRAISQAPLQSLTLSNCFGGATLAGLTSPSLRTLTIKRGGLTSLAGLQAAALETVTVEGVPVVDVAALMDCPALKRLHMQRCTGSPSLSALKNHPALQRVNLIDMPHVIPADVLDGVPVSWNRHAIMDRQKPAEAVEGSLLSGWSTLR